MEMKEAQGISFFSWGNTARVSAPVVATRCWLCSEIPKRSSRRAYARHIRLSHFQYSGET